MTLIPERIAEEARKLCEEHDPSEQMLAEAIFAAEQRGREMERERCIAIITRPLGEGCRAGGLGARSGSEQGKGE